MAKQKRPKREKGKHAKQKVAPVSVPTPRGGVTRRDFVVGGAGGVAGTIATGLLQGSAYELFKVAGQTLINAAMRPSTTTAIVTSTVAVASGVAVVLGTSETLTASGQECWQPKQPPRLGYQVHSTGETPDGFWGP
jgi:hypothetical protein